MFIARFDLTKFYMDKIMIFRFFVLFISFFCFTVNASSNNITEGDPVIEKELYEYMLDLNALAREGMSFNEYTERIPKLIVLKDRFNRSRGGYSDNVADNTTRSYIINSAARQLIDVRKTWKDYMDFKVEYGNFNNYSGDPRELELRGNLIQGRKENLERGLKGADSSLALYAQALDEDKIKSLKSGKASKSTKKVEAKTTARQ